MPDSINRKYEKLHLERIKADQEKIKSAYMKAIDSIFKKVTGITLRGPNFNISNYPTLSDEIDKALLSLSKTIDFTLQNGVKDEWELSTVKNGEIIHKNYGSKNISDTVNKVIYDPQIAALDEYSKRVINGLTVSDRVWKYTNQFRTEIEQNIFSGLSEGRSAIQMARDQVKYLESPDNLFRRVRNAKGNLVLSKNAKLYMPGRGVYRSSLKNAMRLTRDVINDSYRQSDMVRYQTLPFVLGFEVNLSNRHPRVDICDSLKGTYPKTFVWRKWHIQCLCNCMSKLASIEEYAKYEQAILNGTDADFKFNGNVTGLPNQFNKYVKDNIGLTDNWKVKPDWVIENGIKI